MKATRLIMGMPISIDIASQFASREDLDAIFEHFARVDELFSPYRESSEVSAFNRGELSREKLSAPLREVLALCEKTKAETAGYFDIATETGIDPSGLVKGWAIQGAADMLLGRGFSDFYIDAGGDVAASGMNHEGEPWRVGVRNPFGEGVVKVLALSGRGIATSGTYIRGQHIWNPHQRGKELTEVVSLTVVGPNVYDADRFATAAFAMGKRGIEFIDSLEGFEGYQIDRSGIATSTRRFSHYVCSPS